MKLKVLLFCLFSFGLSLSFFQNCARHQSQIEVPSVAGFQALSFAGESCPQQQFPQCKSTETAVAVLTESGCPLYTCVVSPLPVCPQYAPPICRQGEALKIGLDSNGCSVPRCEVLPDMPTSPPPPVEPPPTLPPPSEPAKPADQCPLYMAPLCASNEVVKIFKDANNCDIPRCVAVVTEVPKIQCPLYMPPLCDEDEVLKATKDQNGCEVPSCEPLPPKLPEPISCPLYMAPLCASNEVLKSYTDAKGCEVPRCEVIPVKPAEPVVCPQVLPPLCENGKVISYTDNLGCSQFSCILDPAPICPKYTSPTCSYKYQKEVFAEDSDGCMLYSCMNLGGAIQ